MAFQSETELPSLNGTDYDYDLIVVGGGSGGLAAAKQAAILGKKVALCDYVKPSPVGTEWGLGGTCVNVGCIPKKLMHTASLHGDRLSDSRFYGWSTPDTLTHSWGTMVDNVIGHVKSLNWGYKKELRSKHVDYLNYYATLIDAHTLKLVGKKAKEKVLTTENILLATGGRPRYPDIPGAKEYGITSDDIFHLREHPGKTLCVGASYISLECAGFLAGVGIDVTVMVRSILLRGFDQQMADLIGEQMQSHGVKFIRNCVPTRIEEIESTNLPLLKVTGQYLSGDEIYEDEFNTVIFAIGRDPCTESLGLDAVGVEMDKDGKVICNEREQTNIANIYAIGDILSGGVELTPVAIQAGKLLAKRLYGNSNELTDYRMVPTTVFTPLEYGTVGYAEEDAMKKWGEDGVEVYHHNFIPLEFTVPKRDTTFCYAKIVCLKEENERVVGLHVLGPNAGEITQGFSLAIKLGATKSDFDELIGIHPTCAEVFTTLRIPKSSGADVTATGC